MSSARNRSQSNQSPQVDQRILQHDLEGAGQELMAFDGFQSSGPVLQAKVLQRPQAPQEQGLLQRGLLQQVLDQVRNLFGSIRFRR